MRRSKAGALLVLVLSALGLLVVPAAATTGCDAEGDAGNGRFTIVVLPDTQMATESWPELFRAQTEWIAANAESRDIRYVIHEGDIVERPHQPWQWDRARSALSTLDGKVPYILAVGNHDMDAHGTGNPQWERETEQFNNAFPRSRFASGPSFGGTFPTQLNDSSYHLFSAGGVDWLVLSLKYIPTESETDWANRVIADHPDRKVLLVTHAYSDGARKDRTGQRLWDAMVRRHPNMLFVFSGHYVNAGRIVEPGDAGNLVYQLQADYQSYTDAERNGYLRILEFDTAAGRVDVRTYSPHANAHLTDPQNQFTLTGVNFAG
ncbi:metallophosphoesterase [Amycolatopsis aidingensis]|uniref:metallophosphoesterase n=1 Tax=Amycolatopsis aidingensis TaxID=2842453 RepID=UPI001C0DC54C|nr:metallophosphoesterase [Amycolatopsis aidingensis]